MKPFKKRENATEKTIKMPFKIVDKELNTEPKRLKLSQSVHQINQSIQNQNERHISHMARATLDCNVKVPNSDKTQSSRFNQTNKSKGNITSNFDTSQNA